MESSAETKKASALSKKTVIPVVVILVVLLAVIAVLLVRLLTTVEVEDGATPKIGYETGAKVMLDQDSLQAAYDEALRNAEDGYIGLKYQNDAYSTNGTDFECYIANSESNIYDMFLTIYADAELTDQIFLSGLIPPGSGFENITLDHALELGDHTVYVALTQVDTDEETGEQVIKNQIMHTIEFHVTQ